MRLLKHLDRKPFLFLLLIVFSLLLAAVVISLAPSFPVISDSADYDSLALMLLENPSSLVSPVDGGIQPPLYPVFLAFIYAFFGHSFTAVYVLQFLLVGLTAAFVFLISSDYLKLSLISSSFVAAVVLFWPYLILFSLLLRTEVLFIFLFTVSVWLFLRALAKDSWQSYALAGVVLGLAALTRPVVLLLPFWLILLIFVFLFQGKAKREVSWKRWGLYSLSSLIAFGLVIAPWITASSLAFDKLVPIASNLNAVFEKGNVNLEYLGESAADGQERLVSAKLKNVYLFWNPGAGGYRAKLLLTKYPLAQMGVWIYKAAFFVLLLAAALALRRPSRNLILLGAIIVYFWAVHVTTFPYPRYTLPIMPLVILLAFAFFETIFRKSDSKIIESDRDLL